MQVTGDKSLYVSMDNETKGYTIIESVIIVAAYLASRNNEKSDL